MGRPSLALQAPPPRRRFLVLRILFFMLSLPILYWIATQYGSRLWSYAQSYPALQGFWFWFWTALILFASIALYRRLRRKWIKGRRLIAEIDHRLRRE